MSRGDDKARRFRLHNFLLLLVVAAAVLRSPGPPPRTLNNDDDDIFLLLLDKESVEGVTGLDVAEVFTKNDLRSDANAHARFEAKRDNTCPFAETLGSSNIPFLAFRGRNGTASMRARRRTAVAADAWKPGMMRVMMTMIRVVVIVMRMNEI